jgi:xeroderma pigmentosum group C-complementing protein
MYDYKPHFFVTLNSSIRSYALARHIKQTEVIYPLVEIGKFRGEAVYPRGNVIPLKTSESWMRQGYRIMEGAQPMKMIKQRAVTIHKRRAVERALAEQNGDGSGEGSEGGPMQGLYAKNQTELYIPPPVVDVGFFFLSIPSCRVQLTSV